MKCVAFVIGIDDYEHYKKLNCAVKDATDIANVLRKLKFEVTLLTNCTYYEAHEAITLFIDNLYQNYDAAVFYFAGHGAMINRTDCLLLKDAPAFERDDDIKPKARSLNVDDVMHSFNGIGNQSNIIIVDACRVAYENYRGDTLSDFGMAIKRIPYQTFISFSTAPGTTADDGRDGFNSPFATALLTHIEEEDLDIEMLFKKVRNDIKSVGHSQYPWEHTCLLDRFCFNHGQLSKYYDKPYCKEAFIRSKYPIKIGDIDGDIINGLLSVDESIQIAALNKLAENKERLSDTQKFVIGRTIYSQASSGDKACKDFMHTTSNIERFQIGKFNHLLRGVFYEIFFDENDVQREHPLGNSDLLSLIESIRERINDKNSESFVLDNLSDKACENGYALGKTKDWKFRVKLYGTELLDTMGQEIMQVENITYNDISILSEIKHLNDNQLIEWKDFRALLANKYSLPFQKIQLLPNISTSNKCSNIVLSDEIPDIANLLLEFSRNENPDEIDCLSSSSYIDDIEDVTVLFFHKNEDEIIVKGLMTASVHLEYDGEDAGSISFPGKFSIDMITNAKGDWEILYRNSNIRINTDSFYQ